MSIIRVVHNKDNPFVQINKEALWNENLSLKATGLWARCLSRPNDWRFNIKELVTKCKEGRRAVDGAINELIKHGYAVRLEHWEKSEDGKFTEGGVEYVFFEFPATQEDKNKALEEFKKSFRHCGFGNRRNGDSRNDDLLITKETETDKTQKQREEAPPPTPSLFSYKRVKMSQEKLENLLAELGPDKTNEMMDRLDEYADINPKRFKSYGCHAAVIRKWVRDDAEKGCGSPKVVPLDNKEWARKVVEKLKRDDIEVTMEGLVFINHGAGHNLTILYKEHGFRDQIEGRLRKMGIVMPKL